MPDLVVESVPMQELVLDPENARAHPPENVAAIRRSLLRFGQQRPLVVRDDGRIVAGNGTFLAASSLGWKRIDVVRFSGSAEEARAFAIADNRTAELAAWNDEVLAAQLEELRTGGWDLSDVGFDPAWDVQEDERTYTPAVNVPQYEVVGEQPEVADLYDDRRAEELRTRIRAADGIASDVRDFLLLAASRHTVFEYRRIAEFYPHAEPEVQRLLEESALVLIDVEDAIRLGYVQFADAIAELIEEQT